MDKKTIKRLLKYCYPYMKLLLIVVLLSIITVIFTLITPILIGLAIDTLVGKGKVDFDVLTKQVLMILVVIVLGTIIQWIMGQITNKVTYNITNDLRNKAFDKIKGLPLKHIDNTMHGNIISTIINDIDLIGLGLLQSFTSLITGVLTIVGILGIMLYIKMTIALVVLVLTPLSLIVASVIVKRNHLYFKEQLDLRGKMNGYSEEKIGNLSIIKAFGDEKSNQEEFDCINQEMHRSGVISQFYGALINPTTRLVNSLVYASVATLGAISVLNGSMTVGLLTSFLTYANQYTKPFNEISSVMSEMQTALAACARVFDLLDEDEIIDITEGKEINNPKGYIKIDNLSFRYNPEVPLIEDLSLEALPGQTIAIVGKTGCGKTTLINLLMRFYHQTSGDIYIDGINTKDMTLNYLRSLYGMVLQDSWLFKGTIKDNIAYGKENASLEEIQEAAKKAHVHKFIMSLPNDYETMVEEDGGNISKGQQQLICIARIMLQKPPMLILDEATSSIDTRTELQVQRAFDHMMEGRTSFVVAHRLSTIVNADKIIVMKDGDVKEQGNHNELLAKKGLYYNLYNSQFEQ